VRAARPSVLTTWPFVLALAALIVNDAWLKGAWPGLITGKLSDFAGIAVVAMLGLRRFPRQPWWVYAAIATGFAWWKSPGSQPFIDFTNSLIPGAMGRTVDYADLSALLIMPVCAAVAERVEDFAIPGVAARRLLVAPVAVTTVFGLMATTSAPMRHADYARAVESSAPPDRSRVVQEIEIAAKKNGLKCKACSDPLNWANYAGNDLYLEYTFTDPRTIYIKTRGKEAGFFGDRHIEKLERLRGDLISRLEGLQVGLKFDDSEFTKRGSRL